MSSANIEKGVNVSRNEQNSCEKRQKMRKCKDKLVVDKQNVTVQRTDGSLVTEASYPGKAGVVMAMISQQSRMEMDDMSAYLGDLRESKGDSGREFNRRNRKWKGIGVDYGIAAKGVGVRGGERGNRPVCKRGKGKSDNGGRVELNKKDPYGLLYVAKSRQVSGQYGAFLTKKVGPNEILGIYAFQRLSKEEVEEAEDESYIQYATQEVDGKRVEMCVDGIKGDTPASYMNDGLDWMLNNTRFELVKRHLVVHLVVISTSDIEQGEEAFVPHGAMHWLQELRGNDSPLRQKIVAAYFENGYSQEGTEISQWIESKGRVVTKVRGNYLPTKEGRIKLPSEVGVRAAVDLVEDRRDAANKEEHSHMGCQVEGIKASWVQGNLNEYLKVQPGAVISKVWFKPLEVENIRHQELMTDRFVIREAVEAERVPKIVQHEPGGWEYAFELL